MTDLPLFETVIDAHALADAEFDRINPGVYSAFKAEAFALKSVGVKHYSARAIVTVLRHHRAIRDGSITFKINDHTSTPMAERLVRECPEFKGWFEFRGRKSDEEAA